MEEALINFKNAVENLVNEFLRELKKIWKSVKEFISKIDFNRYMKYKKYQKRVLNRKRLYAKRRAKYGK